MVLLGMLTSGKNLGSEYSGLSKRRKVCRADPREPSNCQDHGMI